MGGATAADPGREGALVGGERDVGERMGDPLVRSESAEKREIGRGLPKLSRLKRSA